MLKKLQLKSGVNRENTRYASENGWYTCDKIRFRQGTPEKIGGWIRISDNEFDGVCRSLFSWVTLAGATHTAVGTNLKFYIQNSGLYHDITPIRAFEATTTLTNPFTTVLGSKTVTVTWTDHGMQTNDLVYFTNAAATGGIPAAELNTRHVVTRTGANTFTVTVATTAATSATTGGGSVTARKYVYAPTLGTNPIATTSGSSVVVVTHTAHGADAGDFVIFSGATAVNGITLSGEYRVIEPLTADTYSVNAGTTASGTGSGGGTAVLAQYLINVGPEINEPYSGWGAGAWGASGWGVGSSTTSEARLWSESNFGEDLIFNPRYGGIYYWDSSGGVSDNRAVSLSSMPGASDVPIAAHAVTVSDVSRLVLGSSW